MASYIDQLRWQAKSHKSIVCFGIDPVLDKFPESISGSTEKKIVKFYSEIIDAIPFEGGISALKPNYAYFAQYGFDGLKALQSLIGKYSGKYTLILDVKRGDIGPSSGAYAKEGFDSFGADALTVSPLMGQDSVSPFIDYCPQGKGVYLLCRTSNTGANDFIAQNMQDGQPLFMSIARKASSSWYSEGVGLVVGATNVGELDMVCRELAHTLKSIPLLIPGVGKQGGSASEVSAVLRKHYQEDIALHRINSSSAISYAFSKAGTTDYVGAALKEIKSMNSQIDFRG